MNNEDKRFIVESVGLDPKKMYGEHICRCGFAYVKIINPTTSSGMYDHVWKAFKKMEDNYHEFIDYLWADNPAFRIWDILTSPPDLAQALLEYFREREGKSNV